MYVIRPAKSDDLDILLKLAKMVHFINLPADRAAIESKIEQSRLSFGDHLDDPHRGLYLFVVEDTETGNVLGTCQIIAQHGFPGKPNTYFDIFEKEMFAEDIKIGTSHRVLRFGFDDDGPTEIGGLILQPVARRHPAKLGRLLSWVRFQYIALHRARFRDHLLAEMMGVLIDGAGGRTSEFWEALGRRFINLPYADADLLSTRTKQFILSLMPREDIYVTLLPAGARMVIGQVGTETIPARAMLEKLGFEYRNQIDPFDGGPHLHAETDRLPIVRQSRRVPLTGLCAPGEATGMALVSSGEGLDFRALTTPIRAGSDPYEGLEIPAEAAEAIGAEAGEAIGFTPIEAPKKSPPRRRTRSAPKKKKVARRH